MIMSFLHKGLKELFMNGKSSKIQHTLQARCLRRLDVLEQAENIEDLNIPGFDFHELHGKPKRFTLHVNGPWCLTFEWREGHAWRVNLEQYH
jgi:toxin HigB-1